VGERAGGAQAGPSHSTVEVVRAFTQTNLELQSTCFVAVDTLQLESRIMLILSSSIYLKMR
jgi:hypothetical protein